RRRDPDDPGSLPRCHSQLPARRRVAGAGDEPLGRVSPRGRRARRPGRPVGARGDRTRERILAAAIATFARKGLAGTSVPDIARQARIRVSTLYHYFRSKEALYQEVQERVDGQVRELVVSALSTGPDLRETTRTAVGGLFDLFLSNRALVLLGYRTALESPARFGTERRIADRWLGLLEGVLK